MCHFLTIAVPGQIMPAVPDRFRHAIHFSAHNNPSINCFIPKGWLSFTVTSGGCSCDLYRDPKESGEDHAQLLKRYRKQGWSETKIQRAIESRKQTASHACGLRADALELVGELLESYREIRLALHGYAGNIETERFHLHDGGNIFLHELKHDASLFPAETTIVIKQDGHPGPQTR